MIRNDLNTVYIDTIELQVDNLLQFKHSIFHNSNSQLLMISSGIKRS